MGNSTYQATKKTSNTYDSRIKKLASINFPKKPSLLYGILLAAIVGAIAFALGLLLPTVGGPVFAILLGLVVRNTIGVMPICLPGLTFSSKAILQWAIILLGFGLSFGQVIKAGVESLWITTVVIITALLVTYLLSKSLKIDDKLRDLIGAGSAICGGSAIAAVAPIIKSEEHETALAISIIFLFNIVAVLTFPFLGHLLNMSDVEFGLWAGTAINDTSSAVAAAYSFSDKAGDYGTIVKLTRATFIIPLCLLYIIIEIKRNKEANETSLNLRRLIPWFIVWFVCASAIRSSGALSSEALTLIGFMAKFLMVLALAAIGLSSDIKSMAKAGWQPILVGLGAWLAVSIVSIAMQGFFTG